MDYSLMKCALSTISSTIDKKPILCAYEEDEDGNKTDF